MGLAQERYTASTKLESARTTTFSSSKETSVYATNLGNCYIFQYVLTPGFDTACKTTPLPLRVDNRWSAYKAEVTGAESPRAGVPLPAAEFIDQSGIRVARAVLMTVEVCQFSIKEIYMPVFDMCCSA